MAYRDYAIKVENVSKIFKLPHERNTSIKSALINFTRRKSGYEIQRALKDISFEVKKGDFFGIVGRNGSGKSTLLKLLAGIYQPSSGNIRINGSLTPFIELGVGFNPELTGRENVYLNGALLGFNRKDMRSMYKDIVEFAELERFMDQKLKNYSSGMQVRLAFSIAIRAKSDILLIDEVLAVGDAAFQKKCLNVFEEYKAADRTIILVTHDMGVVEKYCTKAMFIDTGELKEIAGPHQIAYLYKKQNQDHYSVSLEVAGRSSRVTRKGVEIKLISTNRSSKTSFLYGDQARLKVSWKDESIKNVGIALLKQTGEYVFGANTILDRYKVKGKSITYNLKMDIGPGDYLFKVGLFGETETEAIDFVDDGPSITIQPPQDLNWEGVTKLSHSWE